MRELEPPGAGLPPFERFYLNLYFKIGCTVTSDEVALESFRLTSQEILKVVDENDLGVLSQQIMLPRMQGIEDSSRNWSVLMVLDHLAAVNKFIMDGIRSLKSETQPFQSFDIASFKPNEDADADAIGRFQDTNQRYWSFAKSHQPLRTSLTFLHPWYGLLDGHGWHCFVAAHQKTHRRQIYKILATIGVP